jgi:hypothetical protein
LCALAGWGPNFRLCCRRCRQPLAPGSEATAHWLGCWHSQAVSGAPDLAAVVSAAAASVEAGCFPAPPRLCAASTCCCWRRGSCM